MSNLGVFKCHTLGYLWTLAVMYEPNAAFPSFPFSGVTFFFVIACFCIASVLSCRHIHSNLYSYMVLGYETPVYVFGIDFRRTFGMGR